MIITTRAVHTDEVIRQCSGNSGNGDGHLAVVAMQKPRILQLVLGNMAVIVIEQPQETSKPPVTVPVMQQ